MRVLAATARGLMALAALAALAGGPVFAAPLAVRIGWVTTPDSIVPLIARLPPGATRHLGRSYSIHDVHIGASSQQIKAMDADRIDIAALNYSSLPLAVAYRARRDLRIIADEIQDGHSGYHSATFWVRKDSRINRVKDLKRKTVAINGHGTGIEMALSIVLQENGLSLHDVHVVTLPLAKMAASLTGNAVQLAVPPSIFAADAKFQAIAKPLFTVRDALGVSTLSFWVAREGYIARHRAVLVDLIEDYIRAIRWFEDPKNHDAAIAIVSAYTKIPAAKFNDWAFGPGDFYRDPNAMVDLEALQHNIDTATKLRIIPRRIIAKDYADLSLAAEAAERVR